MPVSLKTILCKICVRSHPFNLCLFSQPFNFDKGRIGTLSVVQTQRSPAKLTIRDELQQIKIHERYGMLATALTILIAILGLAVPLIVHKLDEAVKVQQHAIERSERIEDLKKQEAAAAREAAPVLFFERLKAQGGPGQFTRFSYAVANQGKTTATGITMSAQTIVIRRPKGATNDAFDGYAKAQLQAARTETWAYPDLVANHSHSGFFDDDVKISLHDYEKLLSSNERIYAIAKVTYPGIAGQSQRVDLCMYAFAEAHRKSSDDLTVTNCGFREPIIK